VGVHHPLIAPPICKAYPIAILLYDHCAIFAPPTDPPFVCHTPYNIGGGNIVARRSLGPPHALALEQTQRARVVQPILGPTLSSIHGAPLIEQGYLWSALLIEQGYSWGTTYRAGLFIERTYGLVRLERVLLALDETQTVHIVQPI